MTWMLSNWVERRASQEEHLKNAIDVWMKAQGAILQASESLRKHYEDVASIRFVERSVTRMALEITSSRGRLGQKAGEVKTTVLVLEFVPEVPQIIVSSDRGKLQRFPIEADCDHAFINLCGREILFDEFSRCVLEEAFFVPATAGPFDRKNESEKALEYINDLVRNYDAQQDGRSGRTR